ncbi:hypothetical protein BLX87_12755 [Bacillus sp. VT-16-64]|nr:hypothetical protein BLX87_12755 [Bacillus sp. VT-16-64]
MVLIHFMPRLSGYPFKFFVRAQEGMTAFLDPDMMNHWNLGWQNTTSFSISQLFRFHKSLAFTGLYEQMKGYFVW